MSKYRFLKDSSLERPKNISQEEFISAPYGTEFTYEPKDIPLRVYHYSGSSLFSEDYKLFRSLKNTINYYKGYDDLFDYDILRDKPCSLLCFNSLHFGSGFEKGSIELKSYISGNLIAKATDFRENGVLYDQDDEKIGIVLYNEGFIILNDTRELSSEEFSFYSNTDYFADKLRWTHAFIGCEQSVYFDMDYQIHNQTAVNTYFIHADKAELNHSNDPTYIESGSYTPTSSSYFFKENEDIKVKNTVKSPFVSGSSIFEKQTFITKIGLYDKDKKLIAVGSLANPVRKTENREFIFKLKLDI